METEKAGIQTCVVDIRKAERWVGCLVLLAMASIGLGGAHAQFLSTTSGWANPSFIKPAVLPTRLVHVPRQHPYAVCNRSWTPGL